LLSLLLPPERSTLDFPATYGQPVEVSGSRKAVGKQRDEYWEWPIGEREGNHRGQTRWMGVFRGELIALSSRCVTEMGSFRSDNAVADKSRSRVVISVS
jgi:hypothetical protein